ncbi:MAG: sulfur carrier protein ThiS [Crocinitomicaceae bacterium]|nr:sulfur carrier protein ThiS [Crocinitomicaceae bacterium]
MKVFLGENEIEIAAKTTLKSVLNQQELSDQNGIAVALNEAVVPKARWSDTQLSNGDRIIVIKATAGG